jgi:ERCC4-type nuclease
VVTIVVDVYEPPALVQALSARGCDVVIRRLSVGDYEVSEGVVVERKTVADRFGTVAGVVAASEDALRQTEGLHANLAKRIFDSLH